MARTTTVTLASIVEELREAKAKGAPWYTDIVRVEVQWFDRRSLALQAEREAIEQERPIHNVVYNARPQ